jgi:hypothetical protein
MIDFKYAAAAKDDANISSCTTASTLMLSPESYGTEPKKQTMQSNKRTYIVGKVSQELQ